MDRPLPDPAKLLNEWMEWERGEATPGRVMANLKTAGLRDLLEQLVHEPVSPTEPNQPAEADPSAWTPTV
ncbi:MAG TPA: death domain-containing protein [Acidimicrobiales bacterium]|nr:death domain-containing protein [Acidimicrobiales bacterium]